VPFGVDIGSARVTEAANINAIPTRAYADHVISGNLATVAVLIASRVWVTLEWAQFSPECRKYFIEILATAHDLNG